MSKYKNDIERDADCGDCEPHYCDLPRKTSHRQGGCGPLVPDSQMIRIELERLRHIPMTTAEVEASLIPLIEQAELARAANIKFCRDRNDARLKEMLAKTAEDYFSERALMLIDRLKGNAPKPLPRPSLGTTWGKD